MTIKAPFFLFSAAILLGACSIDPKSYETTPVKISSPAGPVTCQLYTKRLVVWDRSIDRPTKMSVAEADALCKAEGEKEKNAK